MSTDDETLDMSWIDEQERIINNDYYREPVSSVRLITLYINQNDYINEIKKERIEIGQGQGTEAKGQGQGKGQGQSPKEEVDGSQLTQERILYIIEKISERPNSPNIPYPKY